MFLTFFCWHCPTSRLRRQGLLCALGLQVALGDNVCFPYPKGRVVGAFGRHAVSCDCITYRCVLDDGSVVPLEGLSVLLSLGPFPDLVHRSLGVSRQRLVLIVGQYLYTSPRRFSFSRRCSRRARDTGLSWLRCIDARLGRSFPFSSEKH